MGGFSFGASLIDHEVAKRKAVRGSTDLSAALEQGFGATFSDERPGRGELTHRSIAAKVPTDEQRGAFGRRALVTDERQVFAAILARIE
jgi:hypothetical protein